MNLLSLTLWFCQQIYRVTFNDGVNKKVNEKIFYKRREIFVKIFSHNSLVIGGKTLKDSFCGACTTKSYQSLAFF